MNQTIARAVISSSMMLASFSAAAAPIVMAGAVRMVTLDGGSGGDNGCYQMAVAYDGGNNQYYGGAGGFPGCDGTVWNAAGAVIQDVSPINVDVRGVNYNANTHQIEMVSYGSTSGEGPVGLFQMGRDGAGLYTTSNLQLLSQLSGIADDQSVAAYDAGRDVFYSTAYRSGIVNIARRSDGSLDGTITLSGHSIDNTMDYSIGYDMANDVLVTYDFAANDALVFAMSGAFIGASHLSGGGYDASYSMSYTNGMLFVGKNQGGYDGYQIIAAANDLPEPASYLLVFMGLLAAVAARRARRS